MELVTLNRIFSVVTPFLNNLIYNGQCGVGEALPPSLGSPSLPIYLVPTILERWGDCNVTHQDATSLIGTLTLN